LKERNPEIDFDTVFTAQLDFVKKTTTKERIWVWGIPCKVIIGPRLQPRGSNPRADLAQNLSLAPYPLRHCRSIENLNMD
jgi:hypothetical protein